MPVYEYEAAGRRGDVRAGEVVSASRAAVIQGLAQQGLIPIRVWEASRRAARPAGSVGLVGTGVGAQRSGWKLLSREVFGKTNKLKAREILGLTDSLAALLRAGLTIDRALQISVTLAPSAGLQRCGDGLLKAVQAGRTLSSAFAASEQTLPPYFVSMVEAGEIGGALPDALARLAELMRRQLQIRERIRSALFYPAILAGVVLCTLTVLLTFVLPRFESMFAESEAPLPWSTQVVLEVGRLAADYWWLAAAVMALAVSGMTLWLRSSRGSRWFDAWCLRSRMTFGLPGRINTARFLRTTSSLCRNGAPLPLALKTARGTLANVVLVLAVNQVIRAVSAGEALSGAIARSGLFPPLAVQLIRVGEETGRLDELLESAAATLEEESQVRLERMLTLVVPAATIFMGLIVATLVGSVLIGLLSINDIAL